MGEDECRVVVIQGILLRGSAMEKWVEEGQQKWMTDRVTTAVLVGVRLVSNGAPASAKRTRFIVKNKK